MATKYIMQIKIDDVWRSIAPTGGEPYEFDEEDEAQRMLNICYPDICREMRLGGEERARVVTKEFLEKENCKTSFTEKEKG